MHQASLDSWGAFQYQTFRSMLLLVVSCFADPPLLWRKRRFPAVSLHTTTFRGLLPVQHSYCKCEKDLRIVLLQDIK